MTWIEDDTVKAGLKLHADLAKMADKLRSDLDGTRLDQEPGDFSRPSRSARRLR